MLIDYLLVDPISAQSTSTPDALASIAIDHVDEHSEPAAPKQKTKFKRAGSDPESDASASREPGDSSSVAPAVAPEGEEAAVEDTGASGGAFNPETGEINWDCPCLGGMAHGPCGPEFREAFSCFVYSEGEPKGIECVEKFKNMQDCFRRHPEVYAEGMLPSVAFVVLLLMKILTQKLWMMMTSLHPQAMTRWLPRLLLPRRTRHLLLLLLLLQPKTRRLLLFLRLYRRRHRHLPLLLYPYVIVMLYNVTHSTTRTARATWYFG
jgi:hypothetical protein